MAERRIGAFICGCGGNISDYLEIEKVRAAVENDADVVLARTAMFTCSDSTQQEIIEAIREHDLDGIVVASCSPKLHQTTFRAMAKRAGLNQYVYNQVNIREQCSWVHTRDTQGATKKAIDLVRAGIARTRLSLPLDTIRIDTVPQVMVIGAGVAGMRASIAIADIGLTVYLIEKEDQPGGRISDWGRLFPDDRTGSEVSAALIDRVEKNEKITLLTGSEITRREGSVGDFTVEVKGPGGKLDEFNVGAIIVTTGFDLYRPSEGELGMGLAGVMTLDELRRLTATTEGGIVYNGKPVKSIAYIYCVGSRQTDGGANKYCSRYCCTAAVHTSLIVNDLDNSIRQYHLYRDMRTYGKHETIYDESLRRGSVYMKFPDAEPPKVIGTGDRLTVVVRDELTENEEIEIHPDLVVLVNGMVPRDSSALVDVLKLPLGIEGFFNEIHPKLRPVETVVDGVFIAGAAQAPKNLPESVISSVSAVAKSAGLLLKGYIDLAPFIAVVDPGLCTWCGACAEACPYNAISSVDHEGKQIAAVNKAICKGGGPCVPVCKEQAINVEGYRNDQVMAMIDAMIGEKV